MASTAQFRADDRTWQSEIRRIVRDRSRLEGLLGLSDGERAGLGVAERTGFPLRATPYYVSLVDPSDPADPIRRQCIPSAEEGQPAPGDQRDPLGEEAHEVAPHLIRRYPDRALLLATDLCAVHCRHCTRRRRVGRGGPRRLAELEPAMRWLADHPEVREVLVSGGDPLVASDRWISALLSRIRRVRSVEIVRVGSRVPVVLPSRVTPSLCAVLRRHAPLFLTTHFNHPREVTPQAAAACEALADAGVPVANQTVLLRGVNDCARVLMELSWALLRARVRPYYLMQCDPAEGTGHLRTTTARGAELVAAMRGRVSGLGLPTYVLDVPGGAGKVPIGPSYVDARGGGRLHVRSPRGVPGAYFEGTDQTARCSDCLCAADGRADTLDRGFGLG